MARPDRLRLHSTLPKTESEPQANPDTYYARIAIFENARRTPLQLALSATIWRTDLASPQVTILVVLLLGSRIVNLD